MGYVIGIICIIVATALGLYGMKSFSSDLFQRYRTAGGIAVIVVLLLVTVTNMVNQIPAGNVGIVYSFGSIVGQVSEGLQFVAPWKGVVNASIQVQGHKFEKEAKLSSFSSETQDVFVEATINIQVSPQYIQDLYRDVGPDYFDILVRPRVLQAFKDETVKYTSVNIAPNRETIRRIVRGRLTEELKAHSITVQDLLIDNISFRAGFQQSIETKQNNKQLALAEEANVEKKRHLADQEIEEARGKAQAILINATKQAEANRKLAESITPMYIQYLFASKLAPNVSVMMVPSGQPFIMGADMLKQPVVDKK